jgi:DNA-directed RNA polymerase specialized sigma24 family protein
VSYAQLSPGGKYAWWYDERDSLWRAWSIAESKRIDLTRGIPARFFDEEHDTPDLPGSYGAAGWTKDDRYQVATETVIAGMELFRERGLVQGQWNPQGGASLTTYAVGASVRSFRPAYLAWFRSEQTGQAELDTGPRGVGDEPQRDIPDQRATDPYYAAATNDELARILPHITDPQVREGLGWRALGYTQAEAAGRIGLTEKALERRISRARTRILIACVYEPELEEGGAR